VSLPADEDLAPAIHLPDEAEFSQIVRQAVDESKLYDPFMLLEKRVLHAICNGSCPSKIRQDDDYELSEINAPQQKLAKLEAG
jgi:hypothetical protein